MAPSILSADFSRLGDQVAEVMAAGARVIHVDVMDGHFVPPITIGPLVVAAIADQVHDAGGAIDVHLMIERPADHIDEFARAGADCITVHFEADPHVHRTLGAIREAGCLAGVAINPGTPAVAVSGARPRPPTWSSACRSIRAGAGNRSSRPPRRRSRRDPRHRLEPVIEMDGGIDADTGRQPSAEARAPPLFVAGSAVFGAPDAGRGVSAVARSRARRPRHAAASSPRRRRPAAPRSPPASPAPGRPPARLCGALR